MNFKQQLTAALLGIAGLLIPAEVINTMTLGINPVVVFAGVVFAALTGYIFCAWTHRLEADDAPGEPVPDESEPSTCNACGFPSEPEHSGWHALNCTCGEPGGDYEEGWQKP